MKLPHISVANIAANYYYTNTNSFPYISTFSDTHADSYVWQLCLAPSEKELWIIWIKLECGTNFTKDELSLTWSLMSMRHVGKFHVSKDCESEYIVIYFVFGLFIHVLINCFFVVVLMICFNYFCFFFIFSFSSSSTSFFSFLFSSSCSLYIFFFSPFTFLFFFFFLPHVFANIYPDKNI